MTDRSIHQINIESEMRDAYLSYAMSVIVSRALPDARDGLKPVHRRILFAMHDMGVGAAGTHKKSARIVGEVMGKYHPHGDAAVYDTMVRMAQGFSMRYMLIDGQGNFGSIDGDGAAAMRYTEARMATIGGELLVDINKETVDFVENFDGTLNEPSVLPSLVPNLLINGASGIAVGMSTNIPPHNLGEICDALDYMLEQWERLEDIDVDDLMRYVKGPDFPTGGVIYKMRGDEDMLRTALATGRGKITLRAKTHIEDMGRGKSRIIVSELPYQTNKTTLIERIASLVSSGRLDGLADLRDESDRQNAVRLVIELQRSANVTDVLVQLFKLTPLQSTFGIIMLALVDGQPRLLTLKQALRVYLEHRLHVVQRRSQFDMARARERAHVLEGLIIALDNLNAVIQTIRKSRNSETARTNLVKNFKVTEIQAEAILAMALRRLASLEIRRIRQEYKDKLKLIKSLEDLLSSPVKQREHIAEELAALKTEYGDFRRSVIVSSEALFSCVEDFLIPDEVTWVVFGVNKRLCRTVDVRRPKLFGAAKRSPRFLHKCSTSQTIYLFTEAGHCATIPVHQLPPTEDVEAGTDFNELCSLSPKDKIVAMQCLPSAALAGFLFFVTVRGQVKRMHARDIPGVMSSTFSVMNLAKGDKLMTAFFTSGNDTIVLTSDRGYAIHFHEEDVRPTRLNAGGMRGMRLARKSDRVVGASSAQSEDYVWNVSNDGVAKLSQASEYTLQGRGGSGLPSMKLGTEGRKVVAASVGVLTDSVIVLTNKHRVKSVSLRNTELLERGSEGRMSIIDLRENEEVIGVVEYQKLDDARRKSRERHGDEMDQNAADEMAQTTVEEPESIEEGSDSEKTDDSADKLTHKQLTLLLDEADESDTKSSSNGADPNARRDE